MSVTSAPRTPTVTTLSDVKPFGVRFRLKGVPWIPLFILALVLIGAIGGEEHRAAGSERPQSRRRVPVRRSGRRAAASNICSAPTISAATS